MKFKTINDLNLLINKNIQKIPSNVDLVVGIPRSGLFVATLISLYLNLPVTDVDSLLNDSIYKCGTTKVKDNWIKNLSEARKILVVEDSSSSGKSLMRLKEQLKNFKYKDKIVILTVYVTDLTKEYTDMYFEICNPPRIFEWNFMHTKSVENACFDIDGVLCVDPTNEENDDGEKYREFLLNAPLRIAPTYPIGCLVTTRLEKYRKETEEWLKKHNIKYKQLIMMNAASKEERIQMGNHGKFKGEVYKKQKNCNLFVESNWNQATEIAKISDKTVFCTENQEVVGNSKIYEVKNNAKYRIKIALWKIKNKIFKK